MQHQIKEISAQESVAIFRALGSKTRARILELLSEREMNIGEISVALSLTQPSITKHIQILEEAGLVASDYAAAAQGLQKRCRSIFERLVVDLAPKISQTEGFAEIELPIGMYSRVEPHPTCGLASREKIIGFVDAPISFYLPERAGAEILWTSAGSVEYTFPNTLPSNARIKAIELVMEVSSEAPGYRNDWPSDITVWVNAVEIGTWTSPGDLGGVRGQLNPSWYPDNMNQWGILKTWTVKEHGASLDGEPISGVTIGDLNIQPWEPTFVRIGVRPEAMNQGGLTLFGRGFGNYQLGLVLRIWHER